MKKLLFSPNVALLLILALILPPQSAMLMSMPVRPELSRRTLRPTNAGMEESQVRDQLETAFNPPTAGLEEGRIPGQGRSASDDAEVIERAISRLQAMRDIFIATPAVIRILREFLGGQLSIEQALEKIAHEAPQGSSSRQHRITLKTIWLMAEFDLTPQGALIAYGVATQPQEQVIDRLIRHERPHRSRISRPIAKEAVEHAARLNPLFNADPASGLEEGMSRVLLVGGLDLTGQAHQAMVKDRLQQLGRKEIQVDWVSSPQEVMARWGGPNRRYDAVILLDLLFGGDPDRPLAGVQLIEKINSEGAKTASVAVYAYDVTQKSTREQLEALKRAGRLAAYAVPPTDSYAPQWFAEAILKPLDADFRKDLESIRRGRPPFASPPASSSSGLEEEIVDFTNDRGEKIVAAVMKPAGQGPSFPVAMVFHGLTGNKEEEHIRKLAEALTRAGYLTIRLDFRNNRRLGQDRTDPQFNQSDGELSEYSLDGVLEDVATLVEKIPSIIPEADLSRVVLAGHSYGGWTARHVAALSFRGDKRFARLKVQAVADLSGVIHPRASLLRTLMNLRKVNLNRAKARLERWKRKGRFASFENQRYWLGGWEQYAATEDLSAIPRDVPYLYFVGGHDDLVLVQGVEAEYGSAVYEGVPMARPSAYFLEALKLRGVAPVIWPNLKHAYAGPRVPAAAPQDVFDQTIKKTLQEIPPAAPRVSRPVGPGAGLEETKEILRQGFGSATDRLTAEDLRSIRRTSPQRIAVTLRFYSRALADSKWISAEVAERVLLEMAEQLINRRLLYSLPPPLVRKIASSAMDVESEADYLTRKLPDIEAEIRSYRAAADPDDPWAEAFHGLLQEEDRTQGRADWVEAVDFAVQRAVEAFYPNRDDLGTVGKIMWFRDRVKAAGIRELLRELTEIRAPFSPRGNSAYGRLFYEALMERLYHTHFKVDYSGPGADDSQTWFVVSEDPKGSAAELAGKVTHEIVHQMLEETGGTQRFGTGGVSPADWVTQAAEELMGRAFAAHRGESTEPTGAPEAFGPTVRAWLHSSGRKIARTPTSVWTQQIIQNYMNLFPSEWVHYAVGHLVAGVGEELGEEAVWVKTGEDPYGLSLSFVLNTFAQASEGQIHLNELGEAARKFRAWHGLPEEYAAGLEERIDKAKLWNKRPGFLAAADYFNEVVLPAPELTLEHWVELFRLFREETKNVELDRARAQSLADSDQARWILRRVTTPGWAHRPPNKIFEEAVGIYQDVAVYKDLGQVGQFLEDLRGFNTVLPETPRNHDEQDPASGHHRLAWFLMNYFLIRNGYLPFYFASEAEYREIKRKLRVLNSSVDGQGDFLKLLEERVTPSQRAASSPPPAAGLEELLAVEDLIVREVTYAQVVKEIEKANKALSQYPAFDLEKIVQARDPARWTFYSQRERDYAILLSRMNLDELRAQAGQFYTTSRGPDAIVDEIISSRGDSSPYGQISHYIGNVYGLEVLFQDLKEGRQVDPAQLETIERNLQQVAYLREILYRWDNQPKPRSHTLFSAARLEEKGTPAAGLVALTTYVTQPVVADTIRLLAESGKTGDVTSDFPELARLAREAGFKGSAEILKTAASGEAMVTMPVEFAAQGIPVFVQNQWLDQVKESLGKLEAENIIRFEPNPEKAFMVIGDESLFVRPSQMALRINGQTVSHVTPHLLQELQRMDLLKAGSVVMLYPASKDSALIFA